MSEQQQNKSLFIFCLNLLRIGTTGFGGPLVTINLMNEAFVKKLDWISEKEFLERMGMVKLLPGPVSSLMAIALGRKFFGVFGSFCGLVAFILPAFLFIAIWNFGEEFFEKVISAALAHSVLWSFKLYIVAAILVAAYKLLRDAWKTLRYTYRAKLIIFSFILITSALLIDIDRVETEVLGAALLLGLIFYFFLPKRDRLYSLSALGVFVVFVTASLVVFGTGYMVFPYLARELVALNLLTQTDFQKGILLGNLSPGPVVIASTYYGWKLAGWGGAIAATVGIFTGPFLLMNLIFSLLEKLRSKTVVQHLSLCIVPAVVMVLLKFNWELFHSEQFEPYRLAALLSYVILIFTTPRFLIHLAVIFLFTILKML